MHEFFDGQAQEIAEEQAQEDLLDLNEVMRAFGIDELTNLGPVESTHTENLSLLVETEGQRYILRERPEGLLGEDTQHRYTFQRYLQQAGIPVPELRPTLKGEPAAILGGDSFELQRWVAGEGFNKADSRSLRWVEAAW